MPERFMNNVCTKLKKTLIVSLYQIKNQTFKHRKQFNFVEMEIFFLLLYTSKFMFNNIT